MRLPRPGRRSAARPCILEGFVPFEQEVSLVAARTASGAFAAYDSCANTHRNHILDMTEVPAGVSAAAGREALEVARRIADALDYVGVLAVEMFVVREGGLERISSTRSPRGSIIPATGPSRARSRRSSSSMCAPSAAGRLDRLPVWAASR